MTLTDEERTRYRRHIEILEASLPLQDPWAANYLREVKRLLSALEGAEAEVERLRSVVEAAIAYITALPSGVDTNAFFQRRHKLKTAVDALLAQQETPE